MPYIKSLSIHADVKSSIAYILSPEKTEDTLYTASLKRGTSWKEKIRIAIDGLLGCVKNLDDLTCELEMLGFTVKRGKYISVRAEGQQRFVRLKTLGDYYSEDILCERIQIALEEKANSSKGKVNDFNKIFYERIYQVSELVKKNEKLPRKYFKNQPYLLQNDFDVYTLSAQLAVISVSIKKAQMK